MHFVQIGNKVSTMKPVLTGVPQGSIIGPLLFNIFINDTVKASQKFAFILYADDTTLNSTLDSFGNYPEEIQNPIVRELEKIFKWLDVTKLCLNVTKSKFMIFQMPEKRVPQLSLNIEGLHIEQVYEFNFLGLIIDANLNWKAHLNAISTKVLRISGLYSPSCLPGVFHLLLHQGKLLLLAFFVAHFLLFVALFLLTHLFPLKLHLFLHDLQKFCDVRHCSCKRSSA